jgi:ABC-type phosphate transport system substrate-binding protein
MRHRLIMLFCTMTLVTHAHADLVVIVNPKVAIKALSREEVARIFMKKSKTLPNGEEIIPLSQSSRTDVNERFFKGVTGQERMQRDAYWARLLFTGKARPPEDAKTDKNVKERVANDRRYIGYIDASNLDKTVKTVYRLP